MNCDHVFDILTRGPFPTGEPVDQPVEAHLAACHDCRRLAEALRPAVTLIREALGPDEVDDLPGYHGALPAAGPATLPAVLDRAMRESAGPAARIGVRPVTISQRTVRRVCQFSGALLLGAALTLLLHVTMPPVNGTSADGSGLAAASSGAGASRQGTGLGAVALLDALRLPAACTVPTLVPPDRSDDPHGGIGAAGGLHQAAAHGYRCCTQCHAAGLASSPPVRTLAMVTQSCHYCHEEISPQ